MPVNNKLTEGIDSTSYTHINPFVATVDNERQAAKQITYDIDGVKYREEWIGTTEEISALLCVKVPNRNAYNWGSGESWVIDRQRGDLSKLTHNYEDDAEDEIDPTTGEAVTDPIEQNVSVTPWTIRSETTDIGPIDYYILKHKLTVDEAKDIKRDRLALWEQSPYEYRLEYKYKTIRNGYITVDKNPSRTVDSPITLEIAKWILQKSRDKFPLTTCRIVHEEIVRAPSYAKGKVNRKSLKQQLKEAQNNPLRFPSQEFGYELSAIPGCPFEFSFSYPTRFMMTDWNLQVYDKEGNFLMTKEYVSYPEAFPLPLDPTPGDAPTPKTTE